MNDDIDSDMFEGIRLREETLALLSSIFTEKLANTCSVYFETIKNKIQRKFSDIDLRLEMNIGEAFESFDVESIKQLSLFEQQSFNNEGHYYLFMKLSNNFLIGKTTNIFYSETLFPVIFSYIGKIDQIENVYQNTERDILSSLSSALDARDNYTRGHSERVANYSEAIAREYHDLFYKKNYNDIPESWRSLNTLEFCKRIKMAALLHDIGKVGMNDALKKQGELTDEEHHLMKTHVRDSSDIVGKIKRMKDDDIHLIVRQHHEKNNGEGYLSLEKEKIHIGAKIIAMADSYDAMTSTRAYRKALPWYWALDDLRIQSLYKGIYDAEIFLAFELSLIKNFLFCEKKDAESVPKDPYFIALKEFHENTAKYLDENGRFLENNYKDDYKKQSETMSCFSDESRSEDKGKETNDKEIKKSPPYPLICRASYISKLLDYEIPEEAFPVAIALLNKIKDASLIQSILKHFKKDLERRKYFGEYDKNHIVIMTGSDGKDLYNILNLAQNKPGKDVEMITAKILHYPEWEDFNKTREADFESVIEKLTDPTVIKPGSILLYGDISLATA